MNFILDTNIYRNLVKNSNSAQIIELVKKVNSVNKLKNINIFFPISVAMELISHLNDENENERNECLNALTLLVEISVKKEFNYLNFDFVPPLNVLLGYYFFNNEKLFLKEATLIIEISAKLTGLAPLDVGESKLNFISNVRDNLNKMYLRNLS